MLTLHTNGYPTLSLNGAPLSLSRNQLALIIYLAFSAADVSRHQLAHLLWPDLHPDDRLNNLRVSLHHLRQRLPHHLHITRHTVTLRPPYQFSHTHTLHWLEGFSLNPLYDAWLDRHTPNVHNILDSLITRNFSDSLNAAFGHQAYQHLQPIINGEPAALLWLFENRHTMTGVAGAALMHLNWHAAALYLTAYYYASIHLGQFTRTTETLIKIVNLLDLPELLYNTAAKVAPFFHPHLIKKKRPWPQIESPQDVETTIHHYRYLAIRHHHERNPSAAANAAQLYAAAVLAQNLPHATAHLARAAQFCAHAHDFEAANHYLLLATARLPHADTPAHRRLLAQTAHLLTTTQRDNS